MKRNRKRRTAKVRRSLLKGIIVWSGRRMLKRVQRKSLRSITEKPRAAGAWSKLQASISTGIGRSMFDRFRGRPVAPDAPIAPAPSGGSRRRRTGQGFAVALLSAAAVAALKVGVDRVVESERDQKVVTPDFDVFSDDEQ